MCGHGRISVSAQGGHVRAVLIFNCSAIFPAHVKSPSPLSPPAGGVPSLIAGLSVGLLAGYGAYRVSNDKRDVKVSLCKWNVIPQLQRIHLEDAPFMNALY